MCIQMTETKKEKMFQQIVLQFRNELKQQKLKSWSMISC